MVETFAASRPVSEEKRTKSAWERERGRDAQKVALAPRLLALASPGVFFCFFFGRDEMTVSLSFDLFYLRSPHSTYFEHAPAHQQTPASLARGDSSVSPWLPDESPPRR